MTTDDPAPNFPDPQPPNPIVARSVRDILQLELQHAVPSVDPDEGPVMQVELVVRRLVHMAITGDLAAIREIFDRADGKAPRAPRPQPTPRCVTLRWLDDDEVPHAGTA